MWMLCSVPVWADVARLTAVLAAMALSALWWRVRRESETTEHVRVACCGFEIKYYSDGYSTSLATQHLSLIRLSLRTEETHYGTHTSTWHHSPLSTHQLGV